MTRYPARVPRATFECTADPSIVYFAHDPETGLTKIGSTWCMSRLPDRLRQIETVLGHGVTLVGATPGTRAEEYAFHRRLQATRVHGEWFRSSDELAEIVLALPIPATEFPLVVWQGGFQR
jgi:hypothetical protein